MRLEMEGDYLHLTLEEGDRIRITQEDDRQLTVRIGDLLALSPKYLLHDTEVEVESECT
ncbi:hypothetical protein LCGC14_0316430 [marine sediment metagenome]|uniref:Uncharacterized protein n=1 Tax=marine sediment metagenome TaxID=412755 RepID=A0A0F9W7S1_9ZZZZ